VSETANASETVSMYVTFPASVTDTANASETVVAGLAYTSNVAETANASSDVFKRVWYMGYAVLKLRMYLMQ
jgi:hypothetical protein